VLLQPLKWWLIGIGHSIAAQGSSQPIARATDYEPAVMLPAGILHPNQPCQAFTLIVTGFKFRLLKVVVSHCKLA